jgi:ketosteroid isomerase-like protein
MKRLALACAFLFVPAATAIAGDAQVEAPIRQVNVAFNKGDSKAAQANYVPGVIIIDEIPPHAWSGPTSFAVWSAALDAYEKARGISGDRVDLGAVKREVVSGDIAYVIIEATYVFTQKGRAMHEPGALLTYVLKKTPAGWKIAAQTWTGPDPTPVAAKK